MPYKWIIIKLSTCLQEKRSLFVEALLLLQYVWHRDFFFRQQFKYLQIYSMSRLLFLCPNLLLPEGCMVCMTFSCVNDMVVHGSILGSIKVILHQYHESR